MDSKKLTYEQIIELPNHSEVKNYPNPDLIKFGFRCVDTTINRLWSKFNQTKNYTRVDIYEGMQENNLYDYPSDNCWVIDSARFTNENELNEFYTIITTQRDLRKERRDREKKEQRIRFEMVEKFNNVINNKEFDNFLINRTKYYLGELLSDISWINVKNLVAESKSNIKFYVEDIYSNFCRRGLQNKSLNWEVESKNSRFRETNLLAYYSPLRKWIFIVIVIWMST